MSKATDTLQAMGSAASGALNNATAIMLAAVAAITAGRKLPTWALTALAALALGFWGGFALQGHRLVSLRAHQAEAVRLATEKARAQEHAANGVSEVAESAAVASEAAIVTVTRTITKRVPYYVTIKGDAGCIVPVGAVRLFNAAARGDPSGVPGPAAAADGPPATRADAARPPY